MTNNCTILQLNNIMDLTDTKNIYKSTKTKRKQCNKTQKELNINNGTKHLKALHGKQMRGLAENDIILYLKIRCFSIRKLCTILTLNSFNIFYSHN